MHDLPWREIALLRTDMKGTEHFKEIIKNYLDERAKEDELFRAKYETTTRTIDDVVTYILNEVKKSGCCGFSDMEVFSMAVHVYLKLYHIKTKELKFPTLRKMA